MEKQIQKEMSWALAIFFLIGFFGGGIAFSPKAWADDDAGVAGCNAVTVDPNVSLEEQQAVCGNAEQFPNSSCAVGGHGTCSAPKTEGTLVDGNHCVCLSQEPLPVESAPTP